MAIRTWMKYTQGFRFRSAALAAALAASAGAGYLHAETTVAFRLMPAWYFPLDASLMTPGPGVSAALDFLPKPFLDLFVEGEYLRPALYGTTGVDIFDGSVGVGVVWRPAERLSLRAEASAGAYSAKYGETTLSGLAAGCRVSAEYSITPALSATAFASLRRFASTPAPFLDAAGAGIGLKVDLTALLSPEPKVYGEVTRIDPVFPVFYSWYDVNAFGIVRITNDEPTAVTDLRAYFFMDHYMEQPKLCGEKDTLAAGDSVDVELKAFFNESLLDMNERTQGDGTLIVEYRVLGSKRTARIPVNVPLFNRNAMSWTDDRRAAAFASSKDPSALWFSKYVASTVNRRKRAGLPDPVQTAIGMFEALDVFGINYVIDPASAYEDNAGSADSVDFLQYPYQTLMYRGGDCDDLSILYCSLMEAVGVKTAFITIPGHIYTAIDTGMTEAEAKEGFYAPDQLIYRGGKAWLPVEITLTKEGFSKAWRIGMKEWGDASARSEARLYPLEEAWKTYPPVSIPAAESRFALPDEKALIAAIDTSVDSCLASMIKPQIESYREALAKDDTAETRNRLGILYGRSGMLDEARAEFSAAAKRNDPDAWANLGNVAFVEQKYGDALSCYAYVLSLDASNPVALLGAARCNYEMNDFQKSDALYARLRAADPAMALKYSYLGSFFENKGRAWSFSDRLATTAWSVPPKAASPEPTAPAAEKNAMVAEASPSVEPAKEPVPETAERPEPAKTAPETGEVAPASDDRQAKPPEPAPAAVSPAEPSGLASMLSVVRPAATVPEKKDEGEEQTPSMDAVPPATPFDLLAAEPAPAAKDETPESLISLTDLLAGAEKAGEGAEPPSGEESGTLEPPAVPVETAKAEPGSTEPEPAAPLPEPLAPTPVPDAPIAALAPSKPTVVPEPVAPLPVAPSEPPVGDETNLSATAVTEGAMPAPDAPSVPEPAEPPVSEALAAETEPTLPAADAPATGSKPAGTTKPKPKPSAAVAEKPSIVPILRGIAQEGETEPALASAPATPNTESLSEEEPTRPIGNFRTFGVLALIATGITGLSAFIRSFAKSRIRRRKKP